MNKKNKSGIYLWKLILSILIVFVVVISVECFLLIEKKVRELIVGNSEKLNSSIIAELDQITPKVQPEPTTNEETTSVENNEGTQTEDIKNEQAPTEDTAKEETKPEENISDENKDIDKNKTSKSEDKADEKKNETADTTEKDVIADEEKVELQEMATITNQSVANNNNDGIATASANEPKEMLDNDDGIITTISDSLKTGTAPFDANNDPGNDREDGNNILRTYDVAKYVITVGVEKRQNIIYNRGRLFFEMILPLSKEEAVFEYTQMGWLSAFEDIKYEYVTINLNKEQAKQLKLKEGQEVQIIRGSYIAKPVIESMALVSQSSVQVTVNIRALKMHNEEKIKPIYSFWLDHNEAGVYINNEIPTEIATGRMHICSKHNENEVKTIEAQEIVISAAPRYNIEIVESETGKTQTVGNFDFSTGNEYALNKEAGWQEGRLGCYGIMVQIRGKDNQGLRGVEWPSLEDITFDLNLSSNWKPNAGVATDVATDYKPLVWSIEGTKENAKQEDGREIPLVTKYATNVPYNKSPSESEKYKSCYNGGTWRATQEGDTIKVTISDWEGSTNLLDIPRALNQEKENSWSLYKPYAKDNVTEYWNLDKIVISSGEVWVVQPFVNKDGKLITENTKYGACEGQFEVFLTDSNMVMRSESGANGPQAIYDLGKDENDGEDSKKQIFHILKSGTISQNVMYINYKMKEYDDPLTEGCYTNENAPKDWIVAGNNLLIECQFNHDGAEGNAVGVAYDSLIKFDDAFFIPESYVYDTTNKNITWKAGKFSKYGYYILPDDWGLGYNSVEDDNGARLISEALWAAKPNKKGWEHNNLKPNDEGYDTEMKNAGIDELVYFKDLDTLIKQGYVCVGLFVQTRGRSGPGTQNHFHTFISGRCKETAEDGQVYMVSMASKAWNVTSMPVPLPEDVSITDKYANRVNMSNFVKKYIPVINQSGDTPTPLSYDSYPAAFWVNGGNKRSDEQYSKETSLVLDYKKAKYDEKGFVAGDSGTKGGDSCLVMGFESTIDSSFAQKVDGKPKNTYDVGGGQRVVDFVLTLFLEGQKVAGNAPSDDKIERNVYVTVKLPKGLQYINGTANLDGSYQTPSKPSKEIPTFEGGEFINPEIEERDGVTYLKWKVTAELASIYDKWEKKLYFSSEIESQGNDEIDNGLTVEASIYTEGNKIDPKIEWHNLTKQTVYLANNDVRTINILADASAVDRGKPLGFRMQIANNAMNTLKNMLISNSFPYNPTEPQELLSDFDGPLILTDFSAKLIEEKSENVIDEVTGEVTEKKTTITYANINDEGFKLYYTTNSEWKGFIAEDFKNIGIDFTNLDSNWKEIRLDPDCENWSEYSKSGMVIKSFPPSPKEQEENPIIAIIVVGDIKEKCFVEMHNIFDLPEGKERNRLVNFVSQTNLNSQKNNLSEYAKTVIASHTIEGLVWKDSNENGIRENTEALISGVNVTLWKLKEGGDSSKFGDYDTQVTGPDGNPIEIETGYKIDIITGEKVEFEEGKYKFTGVSEGTYTIRFDSGTSEIDDLVLTKAKQGNNEERDSDATLEKKLLEDYHPVIMGIKTKEASTIGSYGLDEIKYQDCGFCSKPVILPLTGGDGIRLFTVIGFAVLTISFSKMKEKVSIALAAKRRRKKRMARSNKYDNYNMYNG